MLNNKKNIRRSTRKKKTPGRQVDHDNRHKLKRRPTQSSSTRSKASSLPPMAPIRPSRAPSIHHNNNTRDIFTITILSEFSTNRREKIRRSTRKWKAPGRLEDHDDRQIPPRAPTRPSRTPSGSTQPPMPQKPPRTPQPTPRPTPPPIAPIPPPADKGQQWLSNEQGYATSLSKFDDNSNFQPPPETAQVMSRNDKYHFSQRAPDPEDSSLKSLKGIANSFSKVDNIVMSTSAKDNDNILDVEAQTYAHVDDQIEGKLAKRLQLPKKTEQIMKRHEGKHFEVNTRYQGIQEMEYNQSMGQDTFVIESKTVGLHGEDQKEDKEYNCKDWAKCAQDKDVNAAFKLLDNDILPDHKDLQLANDNFIDDSEGKELLKNICQKIENRLMETNECIENVTGCLKCDDPMRKIIFVMQTRSESPKIDCQYTFHVKQQHNEQVNEEMKIEKLTGKEFKNRFYKANECLRINSPGLMDSHGNLTGTSLSTVKLRTGQDPEPTTCIVFYVEAKGYVPIGEDLLPSHLEYDTDMVFKTDVRESQCAIATAGPSDKHEELKIGCRIESLKVPDGGTLGGFIDHPEHGLCAITCSHVLFTADEFEKMYRRQIHVKYMAKTMCYQPKNPDICGEVCDVRLLKGNENNGGMDIAFVKVKESHKPKTPSFPDCFADVDPFIVEFLSQKLRYDPGSVMQNSKQLEINNKVVKYGFKSKLTSGTVCCFGSSFRFQMRGEQKNRIIKYILNDLIQVRDDFGKFSDFGDSGAMVFLTNENKELMALGILTGRHDEMKTTFVTPIWNILKEIKIQRPYHLAELRSARKTIE